MYNLMTLVNTAVWHICTWEREWKPTPVFLPGKSHGQRGLVGYSPQGHKESDTSEVTEYARTQSKM